MGKIITVPQPVQMRTSELGHRVRRARLRRGIASAELAAKAGISRNTLTALEAGKPGVTLATFATVLWALGLDATLDPAANPDLDTHGKTLESSRAPKRARTKETGKGRYDF
ncbi:MAG: helix-turn-helix domain-containing protein [Usitatibacter sp.]